MPCCTFEKRSDSFHPLSIFFVCGVLLFMAPLLALLLRGLGRFHPGLARSGGRLRRAITAARKVVATDFLHPTYRCTLSARLMDCSPWLAGQVYRHLNLAALAALWGGLVAVACTSAILL